MEMPKYLQQRRRRWYAVLDIPKDVRPTFGGHPRFVQSLETESLSEAEIRVLRVVAGWKEQIAIARRGSDEHKPDKISTALSWRQELWKVGMDEDARFVAESIVDEQLQKIGQKDRPTAKMMAKIAYGEAYPLDRDIETWLAHQDTQAKTKDMKRADALRFAAKFKLSDDVTRQSLLGWVHHLQVVDGLQAATIRRIISACRGYWDYLHVVGHIENREAAFDRVSPKKMTKIKTAGTAKRQAFEPHDVPKLLVGALDKGDTQLAQLIWMAVWTGCRIEELCSLKVLDVQSGAFSVVDAKTQAGLREVPIHPRLEPVLRHLCTRSTDGYVLSGLTFNKYDDRSNAIGKRFGHLKTALGYDQRFVFHSLRKTVTTELENAGVPENVTADIVGHDKKTITYGIYSKGNRLPVLRDAIRKLSFKVDARIEGRLLNDA